MAVDITIDNVTSNVQVVNKVVTGDGTFDKLMGSVNAQIDNQFNLGRIKGTDYATVYLGAMQTVISQSMQFEIQEKQTEAQIADMLITTALKIKSVPGSTQAELLAAITEIINNISTV